MKIFASSMIVIALTFTMAVVALLWTMPPSARRPEKLFTYRGEAPAVCALDDAGGLRDCVRVKP